MPKGIFTLIFLLVVLGGVLAWQSEQLPCRNVIPYALGNIDSRFGLSLEALLSDLSAAESVWEQAAGRELFEYTPGALLQINLLFDERQERTLENARLDRELAATEAAQNSILAGQRALIAEYDEELAEYHRDIENFRERLDAYNRDVERWNERGGAPPDEYADLQDRAHTLNEEQEALETKRRNVNRMAERINATSAEEVAVVEKYNASLEDFTDRYGEGGETFDEGDFTGRAINIYQFAGREELRTVLAHEFGHALGIDHVENPHSIMYYLMEEQDTAEVSLTDEDRAALLAQCEMTLIDKMRDNADRLWHALKNRNLEPAT